MAALMAVLFRRFDRGRFKVVPSLISGHASVAQANAGRNRVVSVGVA
jgi:hypothetical protein